MSSSALWLHNENAIIFEQRGTVPILTLHRRNFPPSSFRQHNTSHFRNQSIQLTARLTHDHTVDHIFTMRFSITKTLTKYAAKITLAGTRTVARTTKRTKNQRDAERDAAEAEKEWWEAILKQDAEDKRREFHEYNAEWAIEVQKYEEGVMKKQDQELKELKEKNDRQLRELEEKDEQKQQHQQDHIRAMREQAYSLLTENSGLENIEDFEDDESSAPSVDSLTLAPPPCPGLPYPVPSRPIHLSETPPPMVLVCSDVPAALAEMAANDFVLKAPLERRVYIPWWADSIDV